MENAPGNSFIPKSPVRGEVKAKPVRKIYIFTYIAFVFFFGTLLAAAGIFFYKASIEAQLAAKKAQLAEEKKSFDQSSLEEVRDLDKRMNTAFSILDRSVSLPKLFSALESTTLRPVQIAGLEYEKTVNNSLQLALSLHMQDFNAALFQREILSGNNILKDAAISELTYADTQTQSDTKQQTENDRGVSFTLSKTLDIASIAYEGSPQALPGQEASSVANDQEANQSETLSPEQTPPQEESVDTQDTATQDIPDVPSPPDNFSDQ